MAHLIKDFKILGLFTVWHAKFCANIKYPQNYKFSIFYCKFGICFWLRVEYTLSQALVEIVSHQRHQLNPIESKYVL